jgi:hypothetical protein
LFLSLKNNSSFSIDENWNNDLPNKFSKSPISESFGTRSNDEGRLGGFWLGRFGAELIDEMEMEAWPENEKGVVLLELKDKDGS